MGQSGYVGVVHDNALPELISPMPRLLRSVPSSLSQIEPVVLIQPEVDGFLQLLLVVLHRKHIVRPGVDDHFRYLLLASHGVDGDDAALKGQFRQQFRDGRYLI